MKTWLRWDWFLRLAGLAGVGFEVFRDGAERPTLLALYALMLGLPSALKADLKMQNPSRSRKRRKEEDA